MKITPDDASRIARQHAAGMNYHDIAIQRGLTDEAVRSACRRYKDLIPPEADVIHLEEPRTIIGDALVCGDLHSVTIDWAFSDNIAPIARKMGIKTLIIAGDIHNMDPWSSYPHIVTPPTWKQEKEIIRLRMVDWLEVFDDIYILMGNHDRRKQKQYNGQEDDNDLFAYLFSPPCDEKAEQVDLVEAFLKSRKIKTSNLDHMILRSDGEDWFIAHCKEYGRPGVVGNAFAQKYQMNVITHHQHHFCMMMDDFDRYIVIDNGSLMDPDKTAYMKMDATKRPVSKRGFTVIKHGCPYLFGRGRITPWGDWLN